jgi:hypothetical protein
VLELVEAHPRIILARQPVVYWLLRAVAGAVNVLQVLLEALRVVPEDLVAAIADVLLPLTGSCEETPNIRDQDPMLFVEEEHHLVVDRSDLLRAAHECCMSVVPLVNIDADVVPLLERLQGTDAHGVAESSEVQPAIHELGYEVRRQTSSSWGVRQVLLWTHRVLGLVAVAPSDHGVPEAVIVLVLDVEATSAGGQLSRYRSVTTSTRSSLYLLYRLRLGT